MLTKNRFWLSKVSLNPWEDLVLLLLHLLRADQALVRVLVQVTELIKHLNNIILNILTYCRKLFKYLNIINY